MIYIVVLLSSVFFSLCVSALSSLPSEFKAGFKAGASMSGLLASAQLAYSSSTLLLGYTLISYSQNILSGYPARIQIITLTLIF
ncbi:MAG: hypothetical protein R2865_12925 [Deinococcales bacterium]